ncbi:hypothetical protein MET9862_00731 [Methylobacterium symbioticum]|uniref:Uncharacterized protein n=1 Tax=Methylobacterium symbioticum TaxID=2584084 RepID=A0A509E7R2_9HYPH|nr:hypothetical protein MET9862_00731 [Methylobacterium symbioticum]
MQVGSWRMEGGVLLTYATRSRLVPGLHPSVGFGPVVDSLRR